MNRQITSRAFGSLNCRVLDTPDGRSPRLVIVLCHGFGAPGSDLVGLAEPFLQSPEIPTDDVCFVFPEGPLDLAPMGMPGGRAWWSINMAQLAAVYETRDYSVLTEVEPDGLRDASAQMSQAVSQILSAYDVRPEELFLGGFSQGAMLSTDVVLRTGLCPARLILLSGTLLCREEWSRLADVHPGCDVIQTHGTRDMVLPVEPSEWLRDLLAERGFRVQYRQFPGQHEVPLEALQMIADAIVQQTWSASE